MEAFILAAGLGTRLRPLTNDRPKALVAVDGTTLLELAICRVTKAGAKHVVVNVHHFASTMKTFLLRRSWPIPVDISDESPLLLDTGGALRHARGLFRGQGPILVYNVDVLSTFSIEEMLRKHEQGHALATLAVSDRETCRKLLFNEEGQLAGWKNHDNGEEIIVKTANSAVSKNPTLTERAFSGISFVSPRLMSLLPPDDRPYPAIPEYLRLAEHHRIQAYEHPASQWLDVGKPETLPWATAFLNRTSQS